MKKAIWISIMVVALALALAFRPGGREEVVPDTTVDSTDKVEVYYFHLSRRCVTCVAVENKTQEAIIGLYPGEYQKGKITFASVNLEDERASRLLKRQRSQARR
jgi:hypothetical protein